MRSLLKRHILWVSLLAATVASVGVWLFLFRQPPDIRENWSIQADVGAARQDTRETTQNHVATPRLDVATIAQAPDYPGTLAPAVCADKPMLVTGTLVDTVGTPLKDGYVLIVAEPLSQLSVFPRLIPQAIGVAQADAKGSFSATVPTLPLAHAQRYTAIAVVAGHGVGVVELNPFSDLRDVTFRLDREQPVRGRVIGPDGKPAKGVYIGLVRFAEARTDGEPAANAYFPPPTGKSSKWTLSATSDDDGAFILNGIPRSKAPNLELEFQIDDPRFAPVTRSFRPGEGRERDGVYIVTTDGRQEIEVRLSEPRVVEGTVLCQDTNMPLAGAWVGTVMANWSVAGDSQELAIWDKTDAQGRFRTRSGPTGGNLAIYVYPPPGVPYPAWSKGAMPWPAGKMKQEVTIEVPRGLLVHGKVLEAGTDKAVAGASVEYQVCRERPKHVDRDTAARIYLAAEYRRIYTGPDGSFQMPVVAEPGYLLVKAPSNEFVSRLVMHGELQFGSSGGFWYVLEGLTKIEPKLDQTRLDLTIPITRGRTVNCRVVGPRGEAVDRAFVLRTTPRHSLNNQTLSTPWAELVSHGSAELSGCDPTKPDPVYILDIDRQWGTTIYLDARNSGDGSAEVQLETCGSIRVRFVDETGKPWSNYSIGTGNPSMTLWFFFKEGQANPEYGVQDHNDVRYPMHSLDWKRYGGLQTDANGVVTFPSLIPDAPYKLSVRDVSQVVAGKPNETGIPVKVKSGQVLDLGDVVVKRPR